MKTLRETKEQRQKRLAKIEAIFSRISELVESGKIAEAYNLRFEADKLRIFWK